MNVPRRKQRAPRMDVRAHRKKDEGKGCAARRGRRGFTLVELIVVLALIGILAAVSAGGMLAYTRFAKFKQNNENARTLFSAAQSAITYYKASGRLEELREKVKTFDTDPKYVPNAAFAADREMNEQAGSPDVRRDGTISYLMLSKADGEKIIEAVKAEPATDLSEEPELNGKQAQELYKLLRDYVTDTSIYDASICLEFDATEGVVSGVLYCDRAGSFTYGPSSGDANAVDITDRRESHREDIGLGYYSTALSARTPESLQDLSVENVNLKNAETMDVQWFLEEDKQYLKGNVGYHIVLTKKKGEADTTAQPLVEFTLEQEDVMGISVEDGNAPYVKATDVKLYGYDTSGSPTTPANYELNAGEDSDESDGIYFHAYLVQDETHGRGFALSLDALDLELANVMQMPTENAGDLEGRQKALAQTYSAHRLSYTDEADNHYGLNLASGEEIQVSVSILGNTGETQSSASSCVLFASEKKMARSDANGKYDYTYGVANARHLYNVRFRELDESGATASDAASITYQIVGSGADGGAAGASADVAEIAWGGPNGILSYTTENPSGGSDTGVTVPQGRAFKVFSGSGAKKDGIDLPEQKDGKVAYPAFPSIICLNENSKLTSADASADAGADPAGDTGAGADKVAVLSYFAFEPEREVAGGAPASNTLKENVGLVQENQGKIEYVRLAEVDVRGIVKEDVGNATDGALLAANNVGAICGINNGTLTNVKTISGHVTGGANVGGIVGTYGADAEPGDLSGMYNGAQVGGLKNVGGIVGGLVNDAGGTGRDLSSNKNTGIVYGYALPEGKTLGDASAVYPLYIGGIVGSVEGSVTISDCVSSPRPQGGAGTLAEEDLQALQNGNLVGGIIGKLASGQTVENCVVGGAGVDASVPDADVSETDGIPSEALNPEAEGYVLGNALVGGFVGYNAGGTILGASATDSGASLDNVGICGAQVIGSRFVGGIVGANGKLHSGITNALDALDALDEELQAQAQALSKLTHGDFDTASVPSGSTVTGLTFQGLVAAKASLQGASAGVTPTVGVADVDDSADANAAHPAYVGGLAGANFGTLSDCKVAQDDTESLKAKRGSHTLAKADYVGGLVGYHAGAVHYSALSGSPQAITQTIAVVEGRNYVGGLVGYNDDGSADSDAIANCQVKVEAVAGENFVGGLAGVNASLSLVSPPSELSSAAWEVENVTGRSYVGGFAGANLLEATAGDVTISPRAAKLDSVSASGAFVGGLFGYSRLLGAGESATLTQAGGLLPQLLAASGQNDGAEAADGTSAPLTETQLVRLVTEVFAQDTASAFGGTAGGSVSGKTLTIDGQSMDMAQAGADGTTDAGKISGQLFVGGAVGYHAQNAKFVIRNYVAKDSVSASAAVPSTAMPPADTPSAAPWLGFDEKYGAVDALGQPKRYSFSGGILGYVTKDAQLVSCQSLGEVQTAGTYLGGLAEVNEGLVQACQAAQVGGDDRSYVGGVVGLNGYTLDKDGARQPGILRGCAVKQRADSTGGSEVVPTVRGVNVVGGLVAENFGVLEGDATAGSSSALGTVAASGGEVGGLVGINRGQIRNIQGVSVNVNAPGAQYVGGIAGTNEGAILGVSTAKDMTVTGGSSAGGLVGQNKQPASAQQTPQADADSVQTGLIGDWTTESANGSPSLTAHCQNLANVTATDTAGGIAGINDAGARIVRASVQGATVTSGGALGGIAGENRGAIELADLPLGDVSGGATADNSTGVTLKADNATYVGGIVGENLPTGVIQSAETKEETISVDQQVGIAEVLGDEIVPGDQTTDASVADGYAEVSLKWEGSAVTAMGGIAGKNDGRIDSVRFTGSLAGNSGSNGTGDGIVAYGGIAGTNNGTIQDCGLGGADLGSDAATGAMPKEAALSSGAQTYLGGIAGANGPKGKILAILEDETKTRHAKVDIVSDGALATGGIVGYNEGQVGRAAATTVGGSAGGGKTQQGQDADVEKAQDVHSGSNWSIRATGEGAGPVGGVIGIQAGNALYHVRNLAGLTERTVTDGQSAPSGVQSAGDIAGGIIGSVRTLLQADSLTGLEENEPQVKIEFCVNEGPVTARAHAGGIVGEWASAANGRLADCANGKTREYDEKTEPEEDFGDTDARIQVTGIGESGKPGESEEQDDTFVAVAAAGILADCKDLAEGQRLSLVHCANFGIVSEDEQPGAGIAALTGGLAKLQNPSDDNVQIEDGQTRVPARIVVEDCANAGRAKTGAGIALLYGEGAKDIALTVQQCRNYGRPPVARDGAGDEAADEKDANAETLPDAEDAFAGVFAAIVPKDADGSDTVISKASEGIKEGQVTIQHCFGVADVKYPIVPIAEEGLTEEQLKEEQERLAGLFNSTSSDTGDDTNNYYYHVGYAEDPAATDPEGDVWPVPMDTAAIASAVSYQNGFHLGFGEDQSKLHQDRAYLRALSKWTSDFPLLFMQETFDPNSAKTTDETSGATYREDCRGNYNRLEQWLQEACKQLADGKRENPKWLEKTQLSIRLIGETQGASSEADATEGDGTVSAEPIYGILLENLRDYRFAQMQNQLALALEITYLGGGTDAGAPAAEGAQTISVQIPFEKLRDKQGNAVVCALTAEGLGLTENAERETGAATIIGDGVRGTIKLEAWVCQAQASAPTPENEILGSETSGSGTLGGGTPEAGTPETEDGVKSAHLVAVCNLPDAARLQALSSEGNVQMVRQTSGESDPQTGIAVDPMWDAMGEAVTPETAADSEAAMGGDAVTGGDTAVGDETVIGSDIAVDGETVTGSDIAVDEEAVTGGEAVIGGDTTVGGEATIGSGTGGVQVMDVGTGEAGEQETTVYYGFAVNNTTGASYAAEVLQDSTVGSQILKNEAAPFAILGDGDDGQAVEGFVGKMLVGSAESTGRMYPIGLNSPAAETAQILGAEWIQGDLLGQETQTTDVVPVQFGHVVARGLSLPQLMTAGATGQGGTDGSAGANGAAGTTDQSEPNGTTGAGGTGETSGTSGPYILPEPESDGAGTMGAYVPADGYSIRKDEDGRFTVYESPLLRSDSTLGAKCVRTVNSDTSSIGQTVLYEAEDPLAGEKETEPETQGAQDTEVDTESEPETQGAQDTEVVTEPETQGAQDEEVVTEPETQGIQDTDAATESPDGTTDGTADSQEVVVQPASPVEEETETQGEVQTEAELLLTPPEGARLNLDWTVTSQTDAQGGSLAVPESVFQNQLALTAIPGAAAQTTDTTRAWIGADASGALDGTDAAQAAGTDGARKDADAAKAVGGASTAEGVASQGHYEMLAGFYGDAPQEVRSQIEAQTAAAGGQMPSAGQAWNGQSTGAVQAWDEQTMGADQAWNGQSAGAVQIWNDLSDTEMIVSGGSDQAAGQSDAGAAGNVSTGNVQIVGGQPDAGLAAGAYYGSAAIFGGAPDAATLLSGSSLYDGQTKIALDGSTYQFQNLPIDYAGSYLCVRFRAVSSDGVQASAWSDCLWMRMPKASIQTEGIFQTTLTSDYGMEVTDETGALLDLKTVSLTHPALAWKLELPDGMNAGDAGWHLAFYQFVDADVPKDAPEYDAPTYSFDLLRSPDGKGYQIERALTEEEAEEWKKEHPDELMPQGLHRTILLTEDADLYAQEHETNKKLKKAYTLSLDALALGTDVAVSTYAQSLSGLGSCAIANICPQIRVMEYEKDVEKGIRKDYVWVWLALPDVRQEMPFLYDYTALSRTHSVTVEPLLQSRYAKQYEGVEAKRLQLTWVIRKEDLLLWEQQPIVPETAQLDAEKIQSYQRVLDEGQSVNDAFDSQYEKEQNGFLDAEQYVLLPREYAKELADRDADMGAEPPATTQDPGVSPNQGENGGILFEDDGVVFEEGQGATGFAASPETELLGIGIETEAEEEETAEEETADADDWTDGAGQPAPDAGGLVLEDAVGIGIRDGGNGA